MKTYISEHHLRIVGKSWEVRAKIRELAKTGLTVQQFLDRQVKSKSTKVNVQMKPQRQSPENILHLHQSSYPWS